MREQGIPASSFSGHSYLCIINGSSGGLETEIGYPFGGENDTLHVEATPRLPVACATTQR